MAKFWSRLLDSIRGHRGTNLYTPRVTYVSGSELAAMLDPSSLSAVEMWESQPHFRTVVDFVARNVAQLGVHCFTKDGNDRRRDRDSTLATVLEDVDGTMTTFDLIYALVGDLLLYDRAYWGVMRDSSASSGWVIRRLPPTWVEIEMKDPWEVERYKLWRGGGDFVSLSPDKVLAFTGYHPSTLNGSSPTVDSLRGVLSEQVEAAKYRAQIWKRGGRVSSVLERPADAPPWSPDARETFREDWYAKYTGRGSHAGGTPILEDGMQLRRIDFSAQEQQYVEASKLSLQTVASAFHVNPTMIGMNDGANYSNVREFRKMLYGDTLGPIVAQIEARLNTFLIPRLGLNKKERYVEFNIDEKLQGNFEEQAQALQASIGAPWMTRNEGRKLRNLPSLEGGDTLITPLNVLEGGQASALDSGSQNLRSIEAPSKAVEVKYVDEIVESKAKATEQDEEKLAKVFRKHFKRQRRTVISSIKGRKSVELKAGDAPEWWDSDRWDSELQEDILESSLDVSGSVAKKAMRSLGFDPEDFDVSQIEAFLSKVAERISKQVNSTTLKQLQFALEQELDDLEDDEDPVEHVFEKAESSRASEAGLTLATTVAAFATVEAGRQSDPDRAMKRWITNSPNPRASHAAMDGEEVPIDETFSNGLDWPGSYSSDVGEVAGCECSVEVFLAS